jgi:hypothetical protein
MKPIHGATAPKTYGQPVPPAPSYFTLGDTVIYTNDKGVMFTSRVCGFMDAERYAHNLGIDFLPGAYVYLSQHPTELSGAYWFPHFERNLQKI